jgi:hypothetical protein
MPPRSRPVARSDRRQATTPRAVASQYRQANARLTTGTSPCGRTVDAQEWITANPEVHAVQRFGPHLGHTAGPAEASVGHPGHAPAQVMGTGKAEPHGLQAGDRVPHPRQIGRPSSLTRGHWHPMPLRDPPIRLSRAAPQPLSDLWSSVPAHPASTPTSPSAPGGTSPSAGWSGPGWMSAVDRSYPPGQASGRRGRRSRPGGRAARPGPDMGQLSRAIGRSPAHWLAVRRASRTMSVLIRLANDTSVADQDRTLKVASRLHPDDSVTLSHRTGIRGAAMLPGGK